MPADVTYLWSNINLKAEAANAFAVNHEDTSSIPPNSQLLAKHQHCVAVFAYSVLLVKNVNKLTFLANQTDCRAIILNYIKIY